jgi:hypothetical protein
MTSSPISIRLWQKFETSHAQVLDGANRNLKEMIGAFSCERLPLTSRAPLRGRNPRWVIRVGPALAPFAHGITLEFDYSGGKRAISCAGAGIAAAFQRAFVGRTKIWPG